MMCKLREVAIDESEVIGRKVYYKGSEVGHITGVEGGYIKCLIDSDIVAHMIKGGRATFSLEVIDR